jgi:protein-S-isoprenylcysteine O-methyltransferase
MFILYSIFSISLYKITNSLKNNNNNNINNNNKYFQFQLYLISLCIYHISEYFNSLIYHFSKLNFESFLLDQSIEYNIALISSFFEYFIENYFFSIFKSNFIFLFFGLILTIFGHFFRISALFTCKSNFDYLVQYKKKKDHKLVKNGVYKIFNHPSYVGFYLWAIGTQFLMGNLICFIGFIFALYFFFKERIEEEEIFLIEFYGEEYLKYKNDVWEFFPGIRLKEKDVKIAMENFEKKYKNLKIFY